MTDETKLGSSDAVGVQRDDAAAQHLQFRKDHLAELEKRVKRDDYSPEKKALYRAALARARAEVKALEQEAASGTD